MAPAVGLEAIEKIDIFADLEESADLEAGDEADTPSMMADPAPAGPRFGPAAERRGGGVASVGGEGPRALASIGTEHVAAVPDRPLSREDAVEIVLARVVEGAAREGRWDVVVQLARELEARRLARAVPEVGRPRRRTR